MINGIYSSQDQNCGISIFNKHLSESLLKTGVVTKNVNIRNSSYEIDLQNDSILHYVPSAYSTNDLSVRLIELVDKIEGSITVIFHGVYKEFENRFEKDTPCNFQTKQLYQILMKSKNIIALSKSTKSIVESWLWRFNIINKDVFLLDHPGLFVENKIDIVNEPYAFLGGVIRPKKTPNNKSTIKLLKELAQTKIPVWLHGTNLSKSDEVKLKSNKYRKITYGNLPDNTWSNIITNSKVILCPYETRIQSVSGIIAEAISANTYVLSTEFDYAKEMQQRFPELIYIDNDINKWLEVIMKLFKFYKNNEYNYLNWDEFAFELNKILLPKFSEKLIIK